MPHTSAPHNCPKTHSRMVRPRQKKRTVLSVARCWHEHGDVHVAKLDASLRRKDGHYTTYYTSACAVQILRVLCILVVCHT